MTDITFLSEFIDRLKGDPNAAMSDDEKRLLIAALGTPGGQRAILDLYADLDNSGSNRDRRRDLRVEFQFLVNTLETEIRDLENAKSFEISAVFGTGLGVGVAGIGIAATGGAGALIGVAVAVVGAGACKRGLDGVSQSNNLL